MELNKIRIILDDHGEIIPQYLRKPSINQYATNYLIEVAFENKYEDIMIYKIVFNINGKESPAKILAPTNRRFSQNSSTFWEYQLTQYETQYYQEELTFTLTVETEAGKNISTQNVSLLMNKQRYSKLTPVNLENDTTLNSLVYSISSLERVVSEEVEELENRISSVDSSVEYVNTTLNQRIDTVESTLQEDINQSYISALNYIDGSVGELDSRITEDYYDKNAIDSRLTDEINDIYFNVEMDISEAETNLGDRITYSVEELNFKIDSNKKLTENFSKNYTDSKITELVGSAPETLNTIYELSTALQGQDSVITALESAVGEKANAQWVSEQLDKKLTIRNDVTEYPMLYEKSQHGYGQMRILQSTWQDDESVLLSYSAAQRDNYGRIQVATPVKNIDAANKKYVDNGLSGKISAVSGTSYKSILHGTNYKGEIALRPIAETFSAIKNGAIAMYVGADTQWSIEEPSGTLYAHTPIYNYQVATKKYVDDNIYPEIEVYSLTDLFISEMEPMIDYQCSEPLTMLEIESFKDGSNPDKSYYWTITFTTDSSFSILLPDNVKWAPAIPIFDNNKTYVLTFTKFSDIFIGMWTVAG